MELHERISAVRHRVGSDGRDPFSDLKNRIHLALITDLGPQLFSIGADGTVIRDRVEAEIKQHLEGEAGLSRDDRERLLDEIADDVLGYGPLERLLSDESVSEIMVNGPHDIWVERQGRLYETTLRFNDESSPMVDARLPDGSRVNAIIAPLSLSGRLLTIRKFAQKRFDLEELIRIGTLTRDTVDFLRHCVEAELNLLISGGTGAGKTTLLNALSAAVPNANRIVTIEDAAELQLAQQHVLRLEARPKNIEGEGEVAIRDLVRNSLRMRPDRIIVGEVRGAEALDMLQAMNTGHEGSLCTVHSNSPRDALSRIETMVLMAGYELPVRAIRQQVASALDLIIQLERLEDGSRRVTSIVEVQRMESDVITLQELYEFKIDQVLQDGVVVGGLRPTGLRPNFLHKFQKRGVELPTGMFGNGGPGGGQGFNGDAR